MMMHKQRRHQPFRSGKRRRAFFALTAALACMVWMAGCAHPSGDLAAPSLSAQGNGPAEADDNEIYINMDDRSENLPRRFRMCNDDIGDRTGDRDIDLSGLSDLCISGSGQFSATGLALVVQAIGDTNIVIVDLRQESHGFVNAIALSWMDADNKANKGLSTEQVESDEKAKLADLMAMDAVVFPTDDDSQVDVVSVCSEQELAQSLGLCYVRFPVTNNEKPTDDVVDAFVAFMRTQPEDVWLHFHCMEGVGRATMFMVMADCMKNAKTVDLEDIMDRQVLLGGKNLLHSGNRQRAAFIESFYQYCRENDDDFCTNWSQWMRE